MCVLVSEEPIHNINNLRITDRIWAFRKVFLQLALLWLVGVYRTAIVIAIAAEHILSTLNPSLIVAPGVRRGLCAETRGLARCSTAENLTCTHPTSHLSTIIAITPSCDRAHSIGRPLDHPVPPDREPKQQPVRASAMPPVCYRLGLELLQLAFAAAELAPTPRPQAQAPAPQ